MWFPSLLFGFDWTDGDVVTVSGHSTSHFNYCCLGSIGWFYCLAFSILFFIKVAVCGRCLIVLLVKWDDLFSMVVLWVDGVWWMEEFGIKSVLILSFFFLFIFVLFVDVRAFLFVDEVVG